MYGPLYFRQLKREKTSALKCHQGNFDSTMSLSEESRAELKWWIDSIESSYNVIHHGQPELIPLKRMLQQRAGVVSLTQ